MIQRLLFGSGGEHCDLELAVEVRRGEEDEEEVEEKEEEEPEQL